MQKQVVMTFTHLQIRKIHRKTGLKSIYGSLKGSWSGRTPKSSVSGQISAPHLHRTSVPSFSSGSPSSKVVLDVFVMSKSTRHVHVSVESAQRLNHMSRAHTNQFPILCAACSASEKCLSTTIFQEVRKTITIQRLLVALEEFPLLSDVHGVRLCRRPFVSVDCALEVHVIDDFWYGARWSSKNWITFRTPSDPRI